MVVDWRPGAYLHGRLIALSEASADTLRLLRSPVLKPSDPNEPLLPEHNIDIDRLRIGQLVIEPAVSGSRHIVSIDGKAVNLPAGKSTIAVLPLAHKIPDACRRIGIGRTTIYELIGTGELRAIKLR